MATAYIGLGANLDRPEQHIRRALDDLSHAPGIDQLEYSTLYRSAPMGPAGQPDYINAVAKLTTSLTPHNLLSTLQMIEHAHGRVRAEYWGPRTLDLDLLIYDDLQINTTTLTVPHPGIKHRGFVLVPLADLASDLFIPGCGRVSELLATLDTDDVVAVDCVG